MYVRLTATIALLSAPFFALAQTANPFNIPTGGLSATAGQALQLQWTPTTQGTISLVLRSGASNDLEKGVMLVSGYQNSGEYTWTPSDSLPRGSDYTIEIVDDSDPSQTNYTPYFILNTSNVVASTTAGTSSGASSTEGTTKQTSPGTAAVTKTATPTSVSSSGSSAAETTQISLISGSSASPTGSLATGASSHGASATAASSVPAVASGSASKVTAMAGMLGAVALGALAL